MFEFKKMNLVYSANLSLWRYSINFQSFDFWLNNKPLRAIIPRSQLIVVGFRDHHHYANVTWVVENICTFHIILVYKVCYGGAPKIPINEPSYHTTHDNGPINLLPLSIIFLFQALFRAIGMSPNDYRFGVTKIFFRPGKVS